MEMPFTLHYNAVKEHAPRAIVAQPPERGEPGKLEEEHLSGYWWRVFPQTAQDVFFLTSTEHQLDRFAPASGHGVLLALRLLD